MRYKPRGALQVHGRAVVPHGGVQHVVVGLGQLDAGEQVGRDAVEQRQVVRQELGQVDVDDRPQHQDVLGLVRVLQLHADNIAAITLGRCLTQCPRTRPGTSAACRQHHVYTTLHRVTAFPLKL